MKRQSGMLVSWLLVLPGCIVYPPPIIFRPEPPPVVVQQRQAPVVTTAPGAPDQSFTAPDFTTRGRIWNDSLTMAFEFWIDPVEFDQKGVPSGHPFRLFPRYDLDPSHPKERTFYLAPGPHRIHFRSFYKTHHFGHRPGPNGWIDFRVENRDHPCFFCWGVELGRFGGRDP